MMTYLPNSAPCTQQPGETELFRQPAPGPAQQAASEAPAASPTESPAQREQVAQEQPVSRVPTPACSSIARSHQEEIPVDLLREGANMLELKLRQSRCLTPLSLSSKATQALLRQF
jgi:hypothetical protein